jgi:dihydroorotase-like cyclic amidohydrolase
LDLWHSKAEGKAAIDYAFHMIMTDVNDGTIGEMDCFYSSWMADTEAGFADADLADAGVIFGTGFAPNTGGPMNYLKAHP